MYGFTHKAHLKEKIHKIIVFVLNDRSIIQLYPINRSVGSCHASKHDIFKCCYFKARQGKVCYFTKSFSNGISLPKLLIYFANLKKKSLKKKHFSEKSLNYLE